MAFNQDAFSAHAQAVAARFESRRRNFLRTLKVRCAVGALLLVTFPLWFSALTDLDHTSGVITTLGDVVTYIIAGAVIIMGIVAFAIMPLFRYRNHVVQIGSALPGVSGAIQRHVSLKEKIFNELLGFFGDFTLHSDRKLALRSFRDAPTMPEFDDYTTEDYIRGTVGGISVEITEAHLTINRDGQSLPLFDGLFVLFDINDTNLVLHGKFSGKTVLIADHMHDTSSIAGKYQGFQHVTIPDGSFEGKIEAFTTDAEEAKRLLSSGLLRNILRLSGTIREARHQVWHADDRLAYAISSIAHGIGDVLAVAGGTLVNWFTTGNFRTRSTRHENLFSETAVSRNAEIFNEYVHCAFYGDKVLVSIPHKHDLFEPEPIFHPPLLQEDIKLLYDIMTQVAGIAESVVESLPKEVA